MREALERERIKVNLTEKEKPALNITLTKNVTVPETPPILKLYNGTNTTSQVVIQPRVTATIILFSSLAVSVCLSCTLLCLCTRKNRKQVVDEPQVI